MNNNLSYKGYIGSLYFDIQNEVFYGQIQFIKDLITYEGKDAVSLKSAFQEAIDDYITTCQKENKEPEQPFKGSFNVRIGQNLHREAVCYAQEKGIKLNQVVKEALAQHIQ